MIVTEVDDGRCRRCGGPLGVGLKEEPTGWKVYAVCLDPGAPGHDRRVGTVPRRSVGHLDDVIERAERLAGGTGY